MGAIGTEPLWDPIVFEDWERRHSADPSAGELVALVSFHLRELADAERRVRDNPGDELQLLALDAVRGLVAWLLNCLRLLHAGFDHDTDDPDPGASPLRVTDRRPERRLPVLARAP